MPEVIGIDHIYITVASLRRSEEFYDRVMPHLGFRKNSFAIGGNTHIQYFNRFFGYVLRPANSQRGHDAYAPGLHHLCFRVDSEGDVEAAANALRAANVEITAPQLYPQYAPDYVAFFFVDPDGMRLEVTNYRDERRQRHDHWDTIPR